MALVGTGRADPVLFALFIKKIYKKRTKHLKISGKCIGLVVQTESSIKATKMRKKRPPISERAFCFAKAINARSAAALP